MPVNNTYLLIAFDVDKPAEECHCMHMYIDRILFTQLKDPVVKEVFLEEKLYSITGRRTAVVPYLAGNLTWIVIMDVKKSAA